MWACADRIRNSEVAGVIIAADKVSSVSDPLVYRNGLRIPRIKQLSNLKRLGNYTVSDPSGKPGKARSPATIVYIWGPALQLVNIMSK